MAYRLRASGPSPDSSLKPTSAHCSSILSALVMQVSARPTMRSRSWSPSREARGPSRAKAARRPHGAWCWLMPAVMQLLRAAP